MSTNSNNEAGERVIYVGDNTDFDEILSSYHPVGILHVLRWTISIIPYDFCGCGQTGSDMGEIVKYETTAKHKNDKLCECFLVCIACQSLPYRH